MPAASAKPILLLMLLLALPSILSGALGWEMQYQVVTIMSMLVTWIGYRIFHGNHWKILLVILPFYLLYTTSSIILRSYQTFPVWIMGMLGCVLTYLLMRKVVNPAKRIAVLALIPILGGLFIMPNSFAWLGRESDLSPYKLNRVNIVDGSGQAFDTRSLQGQVVVVDVWHSRCLPCIEKFPDLQKLQDRYGGDGSVRIISLNMPIKNEIRGAAQRLTQRYSFEKLYFTDEEQAKKMAIEAVPQFLIFDKNLNCRYAGDLNFGWNIFTANAETIINRLKNE